MLKIDYLEKQRITPAGAGKSLPSTSVDSYLLGSPPQVRVKVKQRIQGQPLARITPAGAGKSLFYGIQESFN